MSALFGPAGNSLSFTEKGYKHSLQIPQYLKEFGLTAFEYQCGRGVNIGLEKAAQFGQAMKTENIAVSLHAPYYISMSSVDEEKRLNSVNYILSSARAVKAMGGDRIVVHTGSCGKITRQQALDLALDTMRLAIKALDNEGLTNIRICPETMGKINQLGDLNEVLTLCELDERLLPCIDFGHLNARTYGSLKTYADFEDIFNQIENRLGISRLREFHSHFSKIEYTVGGEKRHLTFKDNQFGPNFEPIIEITARKNCNTIFICESDGTQAEDAMAMKNYYMELINNENR